MLVSISPAVAAEDVPAEPKPTVEEILNEYHRKSMDAQFSTQTDATTYSTRSGESSKTLEQETVDTLTAAGYEAYNVTADNYESLEALLATDFEKMGLSEDGSYIVIFSNELPNGTPGSNSRAGNIPLPDHIGDGSGGIPTFQHTYNGQTYTMRYVTVTANDNEEFSMITPVDLMDKYGLDDLWEDLNIPVTIISLYKPLQHVGTIYSLLTPFVECLEDTLADSLTYKGGTNWTVTYTEIFDAQEQHWVLSAGVEYVTMKYFLYYNFYNRKTNEYDGVSGEGQYPLNYSRHYNNTEYMKNMAAEAFENDTYFLDEITYVEYRFGEETVIKHYRPLSELYYD